MLRASRVGLLSTRYEIVRDAAVLTLWTPSPFLGGGTFRLDGRAYDVTRGGWNGRRWQLRDAARAVLAVADGVGRGEWTLEAGGTRLAFSRASPLDHDQLARRATDRRGSGATATRIPAAAPVRTDPAEVGSDGTDGAQPVGDVVGRVVRDTVWTGRATADLPGLPAPVQVFVLVCLLSVWDED